jgi:predicted RNase H-like HicB family nuclease
MNAYTIIIEKAASNYAAYSPDVEGCCTTGDSLESTLACMREALEFHFEGLVEYGLEIPKPLGLLHHLAHSTEAEPLFYNLSDMVAFIPVEDLHWNMVLEPEEHGVMF